MKKRVLGFFDYFMLGKSEPPVTVSDLDDLNEFYEILIKILQELLPKLVEAPAETLLTSFGAHVIPFGMGKLKILELVHISLKVPFSYNVFEVFKTQKLFSTLLVKHYFFLKKKLNFYKILNFLKKKKNRN